MDEYFYKDSKFMFVGNDRYDGELFIIGSPVDRSITLNVGGSCFDLVNKGQIEQFIKILTDMQDLLTATELVEVKY